MADAAKVTQAVQPAANDIKAQLDHYLMQGKQWFANLDFNLDANSLDITTGIIVIGILFLLWGAFKLGVKIGKTSLDYNHKLEILARIAKIFHETHSIFDAMHKAAPEDINEQLFKRQAAQLEKLSRILRKDIAMWSITAPTLYLAHSNKLADQFEKTASDLHKAKPTNKMNEKKLKTIVKKHHTPLLSNYESLVKAMRKDIRGGKMDKIIKQIIHG